jgi:hypothetical protein
MLKLVTELEGRSNLLNKILALPEPKDPGTWSLQDPSYGDLDAKVENIPELISIASDLDLFNSKSEAEYWAPVHAWRVLGEMRAKDAALPLLERFDDYHECYWAGDELPDIVANICGGYHINEISNHLFDASKGNASRIMAVSTIKILADLYEDKKGEYIDIIAHCLDESSQNSKSLNTVLILALVDLQAKSKIDNIRRAFQEGRIDSFFAGDIEDVEIDLGLREIRDTKPKHFLDFTPSDELHEHIKYCPECGNSVNNMTLINQGTRIGRNEPCHCGSGKKYKKCCLNIAEVNRLHKTLKSINR